MKKTYEEWKEFVKRNRYDALEFVPDEFMTEEICKVAVKRNGLALEFVPKDFLTEELCKIAVEDDGRALEFVPEYFSTEEICKIAIKNDNNALKFVPEKHKTLGVCKNAIAKTLGAYMDILSFVPEVFQKELTENFIRCFPQKISKGNVELVKITPNTCNKQLEGFFSVFRKNINRLHFWHHEQKQLYFNSVRDIKNRIQRRDFPFYVLYFSGEMVGSVEFEPLRIKDGLRYRDFAFWIDEEYVRKGIMRNCLLLIEEFLFDKYLDGLSVKINAENKPAIHLVEKLNYKFEENEKVNIEDRIDGYADEEVDAVCYSKSRK